MDYNFDKLRAYGKNPDNYVRLSEGEIEKFRKFAELLLLRNSEFNLTSITNPEDIEIKHFIDSLMGVEIIKRYSDGENFSLIDIGSGGGFPGIPLKIALPDGKFVLNDSIQKKTGFLDEVIEELQLDKIVTENERAEFLAKTQYRESFDFCTSRAVAQLPVLLEYCLPFVKIGGTCILYKSGDFEDELELATNALYVLGGKVSDIHKYTLPFSTAARSLIVVEKVFACPEKYPRRPGKATKSPL